MGASRTFYITRDKALSKIHSSLSSLSNEQLEQLLDLVSDNYLLNHAISFASRTTDDGEQIWEDDETDRDLDSAD